MASKKHPQKAFLFVGSLAWPQRLPVLPLFQAPELGELEFNQSPVL